MYMISDLSASAKKIFLALNIDEKSIHNFEEIFDTILAEVYDREVKSLNNKRK